MAGRCGARFVGFFLSFVCGRVFAAAFNATRKRNVSSHLAPNRGSMDRQGIFNLLFVTQNYTGVSDMIFITQFEVCRTISSRITRKEISRFLRLGGDNPDNAAPRITGVVAGNVVRRRFQAGPSISRRGVFTNSKQVRHFSCKRGRSHSLCFHFRVHTRLPHGTYGHLSGRLSSF